jgi:hypothetical protein
LGITDAVMGDLITLPLRLTARAASLWLRATEEVLNRTLAVADRLTPSDGSAASETPMAQQAPPPPRAEPPPPRAEPASPAPPEPEPPPAEPEPAPSVPEPAPAADDRGPFPEAPTHVSEEPVIVEELADRGAEEGAGAQVRVDEPWDGYAQMSAQEVVARLDDATAEQLAAINLYESANRARATVLSAVERQLELISRGGPSQ